MEKRKTFHGRQVGKKRLLPIVFPLFLFLLIPLNGYGDDTPMPEVVQQNSTRITGVVKDAYGEPVIGANVKVVGTTQGTITDFEGKFSINVSGASAKIKISFIGYKDKEVTAKKGVSLNIVLEEDAQTLGEVQVVAYGVQKKVSITGAISSMKGDDLLKTPAGSLSNVLSGQITGISSVQYSGEPGADAADIYVRGVATWNNAKPLIQVDGVERDFSQIDPNEIESVTVLKDASATAVFGVRGANGVILITTKRGAEGKAKVSFSTSAGVNVRTKDLEFANSYQYASYYNMMKVNDGGVATFSDEQLETFRNHSNPLMYPDINWIDYCMNKAAFQSQHNVNISGGTSNMKYFVSAGLFTQGGMFKQFNATDDFNFDYKRYNYRANLDFDVTKTTLLSVNIGGRIETKRTPESGEDQNQLFRKLYWAVPFAGAGIVNGERVVSNSEVLPFTGVDGLSSYYGKGFQTKTTNVLNVDLALNQKLDFITKGLSVKLKGAYNSEYANTKKASSSKAYYTPVANADGSISLRKYGINSKTNTLMLLFNVTYVESAEDEKGPEYVPDPNDAPETTEEGLVLKFHDEFNGTGEPDWNVWRWEEGFQRNQELQWYQKENAICKDGALIITGKEERVKNTNYEAGSSDWKKNREYAEYTSSCLITKDYRFRKGRMLVRAKIPTAMGAWPAIWTTGGSTDSWCWEWPLGGEIDLLEYYLVNGKPSVHANVCWGSDTRWNGKWQSYNRPVAEFIAKDKDWGKKYHIWRMDWCLDEDENTLRLYLDDELMNEIKDLKATTGNGSGGLDDWWRGSYRNPYLDEGNNAGKENDEGFGQCIWLNLALGSNGGEPDLSKFPLEYHVDYVRVYQFE